MLIRRKTNTFKAAESKQLKGTYRDNGKLFFYRKEIKLLKKEIELLEKVHELLIRQKKLEETERLFLNKKSIPLPRFNKNQTQTPISILRPLKYLVD